MSTNLKIELSLPSPSFPQERKSDAIIATSQMLANAWEKIHQTVSGDQLEKLTLNCAVVFGPENYLHSQLKKYTHKYAGGRTVQITQRRKLRKRYYACVENCPLSTLLPKFLR